MSDPAASEVLIRAFSDQSLEIREEALQGLVSLGPFAREKLLSGVRHQTPEVAAGCAEALRQQRNLDGPAIRDILSSLGSDETDHWGVWLIGNLPSERVAPILQELNDVDREIHYALSLLWSFGRSWIAQHWEKNALPRHWRGELRDG